MDTALPLDPEMLRLVKETCICLHVQRASRAVGRHYDAAFRPLGLTNWQFSLLAAVASVDPPSVIELATGLGTDRTTMTRNLHVLQRRSLLVLQPDARDGRIKRAVLTPQGRVLLSRALVRWRAANQEAQAAIPDMHLPALWQALERIPAP